MPKAKTDIENTELIPEKKSAIQISLKQYFDNHAQTVHPYTQSFISVDYNGILKSKEEWDLELANKY